MKMKSIYCRMRSFYEITTSKADSLSSSDNDDTEKLELVIRSAYACSPKKHKLENNPALRNSLLLWDKEFVELEVNRVVNSLFL